MQKLDLVYPLAAESAWDHNEIRYSLRSAEAYFPINQVWVIGHKPAWLTGVQHIPHPDPYPVGQNKDANMIQKILRVCFEPSLTAEFVRMSDDQLFLTPWIKEVQGLPRAQHEVNANSDFTSKDYLQRVRRTWQALGARKLDCLKYEGHIPYLYDKYEFGRIMTSYAYGADYGLCINTLYFNTLYPKPIAPIGVGDIKAQFFGQQKHFSRKDILRRMEGKWFMNYSDPGLTPELKQVIEERFPTKSRFEK